MTSLNDIMKKLENHETRIKNLEKSMKNKPKKDLQKRKSIFDHLIELKSGGFFNKPKNLKEIVEKLAQVSYHYPQQSLTEPLQRAVRQGILGRVKKEKKWAYCKR
ncbi:MAG: hypothetical protein QXL17_05510 [Candidatus Thermoplasmatota archaeon]